MSWLDIFKTKEQKRQDRLFKQNRKNEVLQWCDWLEAAQKATKRGDALETLELKCHTCKSNFLMSVQDVLGNNEQLECKGCPYCDNNVGLDSPFIRKVFKEIKENKL